MPIPRWVAKVNRRILNPKEVKRGVYPVITHVGRSSGDTYHTPLGAHRVEGGFIFFGLYGSETDWVQNALASGTATLMVGEEQFDLVSPRIMTTEHAWQLLPSATKPPPSRLKGTVYLFMGISHLD